MKILRHYKNDKRNSTIQIIGLILGIVTCLFVGQNAIYEYSYDHFNTNGNRIYRTHGSEGKLLASLAKEQLSYIEETARLHPCYRGVTIVVDDKSFYEDKAYFGDGELFSILDFPIVEGNAKDALSHKNQMLISETYAQKLFGSENPIGQTLIVNGSYENNINYTVAGVFKDIPQNSHVRFDVLFSIENILVHRMYTKDNPWRWSNFFTYIKTTQSVDTDQLGSDLYNIALANGSDRAATESTTCRVWPLFKIHLNGQSNYMDNNPTVQNLFTRIFIALIILAIAWLNYINIGIGSALKNRLAFSVKKVLGASSQSVFGELLQKSLGLNLIALASSILLFLLFSTILKSVGILQGKWLSLSFQIIFWSIVIGIQLIGVVIVSLSMFGLIQKQQLANTLSNRSQATHKNHSPWVTLFVLQFSASIVLICFALFSTRQVNELINTDKGIETGQVLAVRSPYFSTGNNIGSDRKIFEDEVLKLPGVTAVSSASYIPGSTIASIMPTRLFGKSEDANINCRMNFVGYDYLPLFGHKLLAGRNFSKAFSTDATGIIINETLAKKYGFNSPDEAIGKEIFWETRNANRHVIGVMEDFHHQSADMPIEPTMFQFWDLANGYCLLKINSSNPLKTIGSIEKLWGQIHQANAFEYLWLNEHYQKQFEKWVQMVRVMKLLSFIAIAIACIGLFGLSSMLLDKRTKEIGIRKVNGARISEVLIMLNRDFVKWVTIAFIIASPIAYYIMHKWLESFAYKTELSWWIFALAGVLALGIALLTVSWQSWRAATRNPVEALRYE